MFKEEKTVLNKQWFVLRLTLLVAVFVGVSVLLAAPVWAQGSASTKSQAKGDEDKRSLWIADSEAQREPKAQRESRAQHEPRAQAKQDVQQVDDPLAGEEVVAQDVNEAGFVTRATIAVEGCEVSEDATIIVQDADGTQGTLVNGDGVTITAEEDQIVLEGTGEDGAIELQDVAGGDNVVSDSPVTVVQSEGFTCEQADDGDGTDDGDDDNGDDDNGDNGDNGDGDNGDNGDGDNGDNGNGNDDDDNNGNDDDDDNNGNDDDDLFNDLFDDDDDLFDVDNDGEIVIVDKPEGEVLDTSELDKLPFTGGPSSSVGALIAGLALLGVGAGVSLWKFGGRNGRRGD